MSNTVIILFLIILFGIVFFTTKNKENYRAYNTQCKKSCKPCIKPCKPCCPQPHPKPQHNKETLVRYFSQLFPVENWSNYDFKYLENLYLSLDAWYTYMIQQYKEIILSKQPNWMIQLPRGDTKPKPWDRLFDGSVCDCLRVGYEQCVNPDTRFSESSVEDCPSWPGLNVGATYHTMVTRAYNSNNPDNNYRRDDQYFLDSLSNNLGYKVSGKKGFPDNTWFEGLAYPGEYGHPEICSSDTSQLDEKQPGILIENPNKRGEFKTLDITWKDGPWYDGQKCKYDKNTKTRSCDLDFQACAFVKSDGSFPKNDRTKGYYCISKEVINRTYPNTYDVDTTNERFENFNPEDCSNFPSVPCSTPPMDDQNKFHGLWLYPLRGIGMWRNMGKSYVSNTKLGYLLENYDFEQLLEIAKVGAGETNINRQVSAIINIIQNGSAFFYNRKVTIKDLEKHGYRQGQISDYLESRKATLNLLKKWYMNGYNGIGLRESPNGFNYNFKLHWPIGTYFSYAAAYDPLVLALMVEKKLDTLQLVGEPQNAKAGLKPAYYFEVFQATPMTDTAVQNSVFKDTNNNQCQSFFMINPTLDIENYLKYGYVSGNKVSNPEIFDAQKMTLSAVKPKFNP